MVGSNPSSVAQSAAALSATSPASSPGKLAWRPPATTKAQSRPIEQGNIQAFASSNKSVARPPKQRKPLAVAAEGKDLKHKREVVRRFNELKKKSQEIEQEDEEKKLILHDFRQIADRRTRAAQTALHGSLDDETVGTRLSIKPQPVNRHRVMKVSPPR